MIGHPVEAHHSLEVATREGDLDRILAGRPPRYVVNPAVLPVWTKRWARPARGPVRLFHAAAVLVSRACAASRIGALIAPKPW